MTDTSSQTKQPRRLIYVDASKVEEEGFRIALYDKVSHATHIVHFSHLTNNTKAEMYALFYAFFYIQKYGFTRCHILGDNQSAVQSQTVQEMASLYGVGVSWIPREANEVADKVSRLSPTVKEEERNLLMMFIDLFGRLSPFQANEQSQKIEALTKEVEALQEKLAKAKEKINNQTKQLSVLQKKGVK
jgi:hypothetical protein